MEQREKFTFLKSYRDAAEMLDGQERLEFYEAVIAFALDGTEPDFTDKAASLFRFIRKDLERGRRLYENGAKGGRPTTKEKPNDNQNDNQNETKKERQKESEEKREKERSKEKENKEEKEKVLKKNLPKPLGGFGGGSEGEREGDFSDKGEEAWHEWFESWTGKLEKGVNLSDYLTEQEDYELMKINFGYGGYMAGAVESFVTSADFDKEDPLETKRQKLIEYKNKYNSLLDEKQAEFGTKEKNTLGKERTEQECVKAASEAKDEKELRAFLKNKAATLNGYADGQKPRSYEELQNFCDALGATDFSPLPLWRDMEFHGWEIKEKENWKAIKSWKGYVIYRIAAEKFKE